MTDTRMTGRILGLDIGEKWVGVALSDPSGTLASPLTRIGVADTRIIMEAICELVRENEVKCVVAGMPYSLDGTVGHQAKRVQDFLQTLSEYLEIPIETWDERSSTIAAEQMMIEAGVDKERRKGQIDAAAAAIILQWYLDSVPSG